MIEENPLAYPDTMRVTLLLTGGNKHAPKGRIIKPVEEDLEKTDHNNNPSTRFVVSGSKNIISAGPGSIARVGDEIFGFYKYENNTVYVNINSIHGPVNGYDPSAATPNFNGRAIFKHSILCPYCSRPSNQ